MIVVVISGLMIAIKARFEEKRMKAHLLREIMKRVSEGSKQRSALPATALSSTPDCWSAAMPATSVSGDKKRTCSFGLEGGGFAQL